MIYFKGCVVRERLRDVGEATEKILNHAGVDYSVLKNEKCCGSPLLRTGFQGEALDAMKKTSRDLEGEKILVSCAGCYRTLKNNYKELLGVDLDVVHTSQFFNTLIEEGKLKLKKLPWTVTYHDPCHLGRHSGVYIEPRKVLSQTAGLVEMDKNLEESRCCGAGGGVKSAYPETAIKTGKSRIQDAESTGARLLVTSCSFCILNLRDALQNCKKDVENINISDVLDISQLVLMGLEQ